jgi:hypothetical protein
MTRKLTIAVHALFITGIMLVATVHDASAQITITAADFAHAGMLVVKNVDSTTTISPGSAGLNQTWDFSNLVPSYTDSVLYMLPAGLPGCNSYPEANLVQKDARVAANYDGSYNYIYYKSTPEGWLVLGQELKISFWGMSFLWHLSYTPSVVILPLPCTYSSSSIQTTIWRSYSASWYNGAQLDTSYTETYLTSNQVVDGSGNIITPEGSFAALRVNETITLLDSTYTYSPGTGWIYDETSTETFHNFRWYANGVGEVGSIRIDGKKGSNGFSFFKSQTIVGTQNKPVTSDIVLYPNPVKDQLNIKSSLPIENIEISDANGRIVNLPMSGNSVQTGLLNPGIYFARIYVSGQSTLLKFLKN